MAWKALGLLVALTIAPVCTNAMTVDLFAQHTIPISPPLLSVGDQGRLLGISYTDDLTFPGGPMRIWDGEWFFTLPTDADFILKISGINPAGHNFIAEFRWAHFSKYILLPPFDPSSTPQDIGIFNGYRNVGVINFAAGIDTSIFDKVSFDATYEVVSHVPIPAALPLLAAALGGLGLIGRRRRACTT